MMGYVEAAQGPLSKPYACHKDDVTQPTYDLDKARQLLEDAGYDPSTMSLTMGFDPADEEMQKSVELFQSSLRELGIELVAVPLGFGPYVDALQSIETTPDVAATYIFGDVPDENNATFKHFHSSFIPGQGGFNWAHYSNPEVDALLEEAASSRDASARCELYKQLQEIIATDYVMINVSNGGRLTTIVQNAAVEGYEANMSHLQTLNVYDMSINR
jgi:peptide/nickel transport system substrate-binding protein